MDEADRFRGCLLGLATGDAVGTTLEFKSRGSFEPIADMVGGGPFHLRPGEWTDDTSMALCLATSLLERGFDAADQMRRYLLWAETGHLASNGRCFDIGNTVAAALRRFKATGEPFAGSTDPATAGNGSIMRLAPVVLYFHPDRAAVLRHAAESSRTTHAAAECIDACRLLADILHRALAGASKEDLLFAGGDAFEGEARVVELARGAWRGKTEGQVRGSGYVVASLEAALWCFLTTASFGEAILRAANLGDDADTTAAVCGQVAGAHYGASGIEERWLSRLHWRNEIASIADDLRRAGSRGPPP